MDIDAESLRAITVAASFVSSRSIQDVVCPRFRKAYIPSNEACCLEPVDIIYAANRSDFMTSQFQLHNYCLHTDQIVTSPIV